MALSPNYKMSDVSKMYKKFNPNYWFPENLVTKTTPDYENWYLRYTIPKHEFTKESACGECVEIRPSYENAPYHLRTIFKFLCYPNGNSKENKGYVSFMLKENAPMFEFCNLKVTFTLIDADEIPRYPQLISKDYGELVVPSPNAITMFGASTYLERDKLLSSDVFCSEVLRVQCEFYYYSTEIFRELSQAPYSMRHSKNRKDQKLVITDRSHQLWEILAKNSPYFKKLLVTDNVKVISPFYKEDYTALNIMVKSILKREEPHFFHIQQVFDLYQFADRVLIPEYKRSCSDYLKEHMTADIAVQVIMMADMHSDAALKDFAIDYSLRHWQDVITTNCWKTLQKTRQDLAIEVNECRLAKEKNIDIKEEAPRKIIQKTADYLEQFEFYQ